MKHRIQKLLSKNMKNVEFHLPIFFYTNKFTAIDDQRTFIFDKWEH